MLHLAFRICGPKTQCGHHYLAWVRSDVRGTAGRCASLIAAAFISMGLFACTLSGEFSPEEYRLAGAYLPAKHKTVYAFREREQAEKVAEKIKISGREAVISEAAVDGGKVYRILVRRDEDRPLQTVWPAPPQKARIEYVGVLGDKKSVPSDLKRVLFGEDDTVGARNSSLTYPKGLSGDGSGNIYVCNRGGIEIFDTVDGTMRSFKPRGYPYIVSPMDIALSSDGRVFVSDYSLRRVLAYRDNRLIAVIGKKEGFEKPCGLAIDEKRQRLYVSDLKRNVVFAFTLEGELLFTIDSRLDGPPESRFGAPTGLAVNSKGTLYVIDQGGAKVNMYSPDGEFINAFGGCRGAPGHFVRPKGISVDSGDNVYVTDTVFNNFQVFGPEGKLLLVVGADDKGRSRLRIPFFMHIDSGDRIYISELGAHRVQIFRYLGNTEEGGDTANAEQ